MPVILGILFGITVELFGFLFLGEGDFSVFYDIAIDEVTLDHFLGFFRNVFLTHTEKFERLLVAPIVFLGIVAVGVSALFGVIVDRVLGVGKDLGTLENELPNGFAFERVGRGKLYGKSRIGKGSNIFPKTLFVISDAAFFCLFVFSASGKREKKRGAKCENEGGAEKNFFHKFLPIST